MLLVCALLAGEAHSRELSRAVLLGGHGYERPIDLGEYTPPADARSPSQRFEGRLTLVRQGRNGFNPVSVDRSFLDGGHHDVGSLPEFDFDFVADGGNFIPVRRGAIPGRHSSWEMILEPGRVWESTEDAGYARASLPFTLEERNENCMHNGVLTFLFRSNGSVSHAAWQISSETCMYQKFDAWGWLAAKYTPRALEGADRVVAAFRREVAARLPVRPIARLAMDYAGAVPANIGAASEVSPENLTTYGFVIDGVHYTGGCPTRHGEYPFCEALDLPSYSLAKSMVAGITLMRLEHLYPGVAQALIRDYVPECATDHRWDGVTFANTLDMATGLYRSSADQADENAADTSRFFFPADHAHKIRFGCREYTRQVPPGKLWVYHTSDTYVLGTALNAYVRRRLGPAADFYRDILAKPLWERLALSPPASVTRRTYDREAQPFTGYGLTLHADDIAKLALYLVASGGHIGSAETLDPQMLGAALQQRPGDRGLQAGAVGLRYKNGFWAYEAAPALGCAGEVWIPFMSGFGGLQVVLMPNRTVYYYVSDGGDYHWAGAAAESNRIRRFCQP